MARNRQHDNRQTVDEPVKAAEEMGATMFRLSARAAEQSLNGFSRMFGFGENAPDVFQQFARGTEAMQNSALVFAGAYRDVSLEYVNWAQNQMQSSSTALSRMMQNRTPDQLVAAYNQFFRRERSTASDLKSPPCRDREGSSRPHSLKNH